MKFNEKISDKLLFTIVKIFLFFIFVYILLRAYNLSITHDEVLTIAFHANVPWREGFTSFMANNHFLNTMIVKLVLFFAPYNEVLLRSSAWLGLIIYLIFTWLILKPNLQRQVFVGGILLLALNPYVQDFFALARGYGLALGFTMGSIYFFNKLLERPTGKNKILLGLFLILSVLANLAWLDFVFPAVLLFALLGIYVAKQKQIGKLRYYLQKIILPVVVFSLVLIGIIYRPLFGLIKNNELYAGGARGWFQDTVSNLVSSSAYNQSYAQYFYWLVLLGVIVIMIVALGLLIWKLSKRLAFSKVNRQLLVVVSLIIINGLIISLQHSVLKIPVPMPRAALYLIPLLGLVFIFLWQSLLELGQKTKLINFGLGIISALLILHGLFCLNLQSAHDWRYDADSKFVVSDLYLLEADVPATEKITLGVTWFFEPSVNYYLAKYNLVDKFNFTQRKNYFDDSYEYYYLAAQDRILAEYSGLILIKEYPASNVYLYIAPRRLQLISDKL